MTTRDSSDPPKKSRTVIRNILLSLLVFFIFIVALEFTLRSTHLFGARISWSEPDSTLGFRYVPNSKYWFYKENDHPISGRINKYGWRDRDWSREKDANTFRIAILGDSFVEAFQVEPESTFIALAQRQLYEALGPRIELMNFGRSGFTQTEELFVLENQVAAFSPDMAIVFFLPGNDIEDVRRETAPTALRPFYKVSPEGTLLLDTSFTNLPEYRKMCFIDKFKRRSALISLLAERYNAFKMAAAAKRQFKAEGRDASRKGQIHGPLSLCTANPDTAYVQSYQLNKILIAAMVEYCREKGIRFMLVTIDIGSYIPEVERKYESADSTFDTNFFEDDLKKYAASLNIDYVGLQGVFRQAYENGRAPLHWTHWNYKGHRVVAGALANELKSIAADSEEHRPAGYRVKN
ncbi:MAG: SGNH/GDSL hydrolase family protein [Candidatus Eisenbacteria bacterium]|nr:SGNH/GDSL hydrolase family protein [Candidatus Eisenbacteria bacterium]